MDTFLIFLFVIYVLSPIPLLVLFIVAQKKANRRKRELETQREQSRNNEELYRQYVNQLQRQVKSLDPDASIDFVSQKTANAASNVATSAAAPTPVAVQAVQTPQVPQVGPHPTPTPTVPMQPAAPTPTVPIPSQPVAVKDNSHTNLILITGVILLLLASVGFISATWSSLGIGVRAVCLFSFSAIFLGAGILARSKFHLNSTSIAFYSIGSVALPITIIGASAFGLFGGHFGLEIPEIYHTMLLSFSALMVLMVFGSTFFRSRVFAAGALSCLSLDVITLAYMFEYPWSTDVLLVALFAAGITLSAPLLRKIPEQSAFYPFSRVFEVFAIVNLYVMTVVALAVSEYGVFSGAFLLGLAAVFLFASILGRKTGLLALPAILLILVGTAQLLQIRNDFQMYIIWMIAVGVTFAALSLHIQERKALSNVLLAFSLIFLIGAGLPEFFFCGLSLSWSVVPMSLVMTAALVFLSVKKKKAIISAGAVLPVFTLFWGAACRLIHDAGGSDRLKIWNFIGRSDTVGYMLAGMIIAGVIYLVFSYIPHHRFFTSTGNIFLFVLMYFFGVYFITSLGRTLIPMSIFTVIAGALCIWNACRNDRLNVRDLTMEEMPRSIKANRCFYASFLPVCLAEFFEVIHKKESVPVYFAVLISLIALCYLFLFYRSGKKGQSAFDFRSGSAAATLSVYTTSFVVLILHIVTIYANEKVIIVNYPAMHILIHMIPLLVPAFLFWVAAREIRKDKTASTSVRVFIWTLMGLLAFGFVFSYVRDLSLEGYPNNFYTSIGFILPLISCLILLFLVVRSFVKKGEATTSVQKAMFHFALIVTIIAGFFRFSGLVPDDAMPALPILLGLILILFMLLFRNDSRITTAVLEVALPATVVCWNIMATGDYYFRKVKGIPVICQVLIYLLPVVVYCGILLARKKTPVSHRPIFWAALASQISVFLAVPFLTQKANVHYENLASFYERITKDATVLDDSFRFGSYSFAASHFSVITLTGFLLILLCIFLLDKSSGGRRRVGALALVTLSAIVWLPILGLPSLSHLMEQFYLLPGAVFVCLLPWIFPAGTTETIGTGGTTRNGKGDLSLPSSEGGKGIAMARLIYAIVSMAILAIIALLCDDLFSLVFFGVVSFIILVAGYFLHKKAYIILGTVCVLGMLAYIANRIWGDMVWWIYLFATGATLITIAVRNEIRKRKN